MRLRARADQSDEPCAGHGLREGQTVHVEGDTAFDDVPPNLATTVVDSTRTTSTTGELEIGGN